MLELERAAKDGRSDSRTEAAQMNNTNTQSRNVSGVNMDQIKATLTEALYIPGRHGLEREYPAGTVIDVSVEDLGELEGFDMDLSPVQGEMCWTADFDGRSVILRRHQFDVVDGACLALAQA